MQGENDGTIIQRHADAFLHVYKENLCIYYKASYLEYCLEDRNLVELNSRELPAKQARRVAKCPVDTAGIDMCDGSKSVLRGSLLTEDVLLYT